MKVYVHIIYLIFLGCNTTGKLKPIQEMNTGLGIGPMNIHHRAKESVRQLLNKTIVGVYHDSSKKEVRIYSDNGRHRRVQFLSRSKKGGLEIDKDSKYSKKKISGEKPSSFSRESLDEVYFDQNTTGNNKSFVVSLDESDASKNLKAFDDNKSNVHLVRTSTNGTSVVMAKLDKKDVIEKLKAAFPNNNDMVWAIAVDILGFTEGDEEESDLSDLPKTQKIEKNNILKNPQYRQKIRKCLDEAEIEKDSNKTVAEGSIVNLKAFKVDRGVYALGEDDNGEVFACYYQINASPKDVEDSDDSEESNTIRVVD